MKKNKRFVIKVLKNIAIRSCDSYSWCGIYEPKKPQALKMIKKNVSK